VIGVLQPARQLLAAVIVGPFAGIALMTGVPQLLKAQNSQEAALAALLVSAGVFSAGLTGWLALTGAGSRLSWAAVSAAGSVMTFGVVWWAAAQGFDRWSAEIERRAAVLGLIMLVVSGAQVWWSARAWRVAKVTKNQKWDDWREPKVMPQGGAVTNMYADRLKIVLIGSGGLAVFTAIIKVFDLSTIAGDPPEIATLFYTAGWGLALLFSGFWFAHWFRHISSVGLILAGLVLGGATVVGIVVSRVDQGWAQMQWLPVFSGVIAAILVLWGGWAIWQQGAKARRDAAGSAVILRLLSLTDDEIAPVLTASVVGDRDALTDELEMLVDDPDVLARSCAPRPAWGAIGAALDPGGEQPWPSSGVLHGDEDLLPGIHGIWVAHLEPPRAQEVAEYLQRLGGLEFGQAYASIYPEERSPQYGADEEREARAAIEELRMFYASVAADGNHVLMRIW
jgi:hypothetical protein